MTAVTVKHKFHAKGQVFPVGAEFDYEEDLAPKFTELDLTRYYDAGWVDIEGQPPGPAVDPNRRVTVRPESLRFGVKGKKAGG